MKAYFAGFHCWEKASAEVATPMSAIPEALASADTIKKGTPVVITLSCACVKEKKNIISKYKGIFFIIKYVIN